MTCLSKVNGDNMNIGIVLAGGIGSRFGSDVPKQYQLINGKEVMSYSIEALKNSKLIDKIIITSQNKYIKQLHDKYYVDVIEGGDTRNKSLYNALKYINDNFDCTKVIILEAARPMITTEIINDYLMRLDAADAVITGQKIVASLGCYFKHIVNRDDYYLIEAPEAFNFKLLYNNFDPNSKITATNQQLPEGAKLDINFDFTNNLKITYFQDLKYCEKIMGER